MDNSPLAHNLPDPVGPCTCGSALPHRLCCGARKLTARGQPALFAEGDAADQAAEEWDLALTTVHALASVLPDVPIPLLGNATLRELHRSGPEERRAAFEFVEAVSRSAQTMGMEFPLQATLAALRAPDSPEYSPQEREEVVLATFTLQLLARGVETAAILGGQRLFRDLVRILAPDLRSPSVIAAAIDYAVCWMHFRPEANEEYPEGRREVAELYGVDPDVVAQHFAEMKQALKLVWFDPRYAVQDAAWQQRLEETARALAEGEDDVPPSLD